MAKDKYGFSTRKKWPYLGEIDVDDVVVPDIRVTAVMPPELEEQFRGSIRAQGVLNPIKCIWDGQNIILVDGLHRLMEARASGQKTVPAVVVPGTIRDVMLQNITTGKLQGRGKVTDMIKVIRYLVDEEKMDLADIAAKTGYKLRYLEDLLAISRAHPDLLRALDEEQISLGAARELARIPDPEVMLRLLYQVIMYRMRVQDVKELVDKTLEVMQKNRQRQQEQKQPRPRGEVKLECFVCGEQYPAAMMKAPILCPACMGILFEVKAQKRAMIEEAKQQAAQPAPGQGGGPGGEDRIIKAEPIESEITVEVPSNPAEKNINSGTVETPENREKPSEASSSEVSET